MALTLASDLTKLGVSMSYPDSVNAGADADANTRSRQG